MVSRAMRVASTVNTFPVSNPSLPLSSAGERGVLTTRMPSSFNPSVKSTIPTNVGVKYHYSIGLGYLAVLSDRRGTNPGISPDWCPHALGAIVGKGLKILSFFKGSFGKDFAGGNRSLSTATMPANLSNVIHLILF